MKSQEQSDSNSGQFTELEGGCHCGAVRFKARVPIDAVVLNCNCSICQKTGFQHLMADHADFELLSGQSELTSYRFHTGQANHLFCSVCGVKSFYQPRSHPTAWSLNTHCIDGFDAGQWHIESFNGQNWTQAKQELKS